MYNWIYMNYKAYQVLEVIQSCIDLYQLQATSRKDINWRVLTIKKLHILYISYNNTQKCLVQIKKNLDHLFYTQVAVTTILVCSEALCYILLLRPVWRRQVNTPILHFYVSTRENPNGSFLWVNLNLWCNL